MISYQLETDISVEDYLEILKDSGLGVRRPMHDPEFLKRAIQGSNLLVTAREHGKLIGLLRGLTDHCYRTFVADLAVAKNHQRKGIGKKLLEFTRNLAPEARLFLFSAEDSELFYLKLGFELHPRCFQWK